VTTQPRWAFCSRCAGLFFAPNAAMSVCPVGGPHNITVTYDYALSYDEGTVVPTEKMLAVMLSKVGDGYTESIPQRFGTTVPQEFDCSGLVWYAANQAGIPMPGGPADDVAALVTTEMVWLAAQPGAQLVRSPADVLAGDVIAFTGGDPVPFRLIVGGVAFPAGMFGHIGMAVSPNWYVSAYDTAQGVRVNPIAGDVFNVAVRMAA
jgi:NlpC/P60 family